MIYTVHNAILRQLQEDPNVETEFASDLTGTATSSGTTITTTGMDSTKFGVDDYVGNSTIGYRRIISVGTGTFEVDEAYKSEFTDASLKRIVVKMGLGRNVKLALEGKAIGVALISSKDLGGTLPYHEVDVQYDFLFVVGFREANEIDVEKKKSDYDKMVRDAVCKDSTFGGAVMDNTIMGRFTFVESPNTQEEHFGFATLSCLRTEEAANR